MTKVVTDEELLYQLVKILSNHCGEDGDNEGAIATLERIIRKAKAWDNSIYKVISEENKRLHEQISQLKKHLVTVDDITYSITEKKLVEILNETKEED